MRRLIGFFIVISLTLFMAATAGWFFLREKKIPEEGGREVIKNFSFTSTKDLDELDEKVLARKRTSYNIVDYGGRKCLKAVSEDSASALYCKKRLSLKRNPFVSWDWKAEVFPALKHKEALNKKKEFDFVGQVYVIFYDRFFLKAKCIQYVWTREIPVGTVCPSPYTKNVMLMVLESGPSDEWKHEQRDIKEDFRHLFGTEPDKEVDAISFMTDADSSTSRAVAYYSNLQFGYLGTALPDSPETGREDSDDSYKDAGKIRGKAKEERMEPVQKQKPVPSGVSGENSIERDQANDAGSKERKISSSQGEKAVDDTVVKKEESSDT